MGGGVNAHLRVNWEFRNVCRVAAVWNIASEVPMTGAWRVGPAVRRLGSAEQSEGERCRAEGLHEAAANPATRSPCSAELRLSPCGRPGRGGLRPGALLFRRHTEQGRVAHLRSGSRDRQDVPHARAARCRPLGFLDDPGGVPDRPRGLRGGLEARGEAASRRSPAGGPGDGGLVVQSRQLVLAALDHGPAAGGTGPARVQRLPRRALAVISQRDRLASRRRGHGRLPGLVRG